MNKPFLLIAGHNYYPSMGTNDWQGRYATRDEAEEAKDELFKKEKYLDWYEIVDLRLDDK